MKKFLIASVLVLLGISFCFASGKGELGRSDLKILTENIIKWKSHDITSYSIKVLYGAGNRPEAVFDIRVVNKKVVSCLRNDVPLSDFSGVARYTIDAMHEDSKKLVRSNKKKASMLYILTYDSKYGYITSLNRIYNPKASPEGTAPNDYSYRIKVYDFVPEEPVKE